jgi:GNAT superfamily N-acetyltransferase
MALNGCGIWDTAQVLKISPTTLISDYTTHFLIWERVLGSRIATLERLDIRKEGTRMDIRRAQSSDISGIVALSEEKRIEYQGYSPVFWRKAAHASSRQETYLHRLLDDDQIIALMAEEDGDMRGFILATITQAPPVYDPGGPVCIIDDFTVATAPEWETVGVALLQAVQEQAKGQGAVLSVVVCGHQDGPKRQMLQRAGLPIASEWYVNPL